jgi:peptide/nickel transport system substrate-binding protein
MLRRTLLKGLAASASLPAFVRSAHAAPGTLNVAMTLADIPLTTGQPSGGSEGARFIGMTIYDGLINWDMSRGDVPATLTPGLAESWTIDPETKTSLTFKLRRGVKFHDGSAFNADAVVFNLDKLLNKSSPQYDQAQATQAGVQIFPIKSYRKIDEFTVEITTHQTNSVFIYQMPQIFMSSPARWEEMGRDWTKVASRPSGTGPWILDKLVPRDRAELVRNPNYWNAGRIPKSERLVLFCIPDGTTRVAALLSGKVDFIEAPPSDTFGRLRSSGMQVIIKPYPHIWPYQLSVVSDSPFKDVRVRKAANLAVDRKGLCELLGDTAMPAKGMYPDNSPWFGKPSFEIKHDPKAAKALLAEAGYGPSKPAKIKLLIAPAGSGQMNPMPMNEFIQENLRDVGFEVELQVMEWEALRSRRRLGADAPENKGAHGLNHSWGLHDPDGALMGPVSSTSHPAKGGYNWGIYTDPKADALIAAAKAEFDPAKQNEALARMHEYMVDNAVWLWVVHDLNPRALSPKVKGFTQAQSWFQDLTPVSVE